MTVTEVTVIRKWVGLSTDTKPTTATMGDESYVGNEFYEINTGLTWIWDGEYWTEDLKLFRAMVDALAEV
jgi:hypothetical protein